MKPVLRCVEEPSRASTSNRSEQHGSASLHSNAPSPPPWRRHPSRCVPTYWQGYSLGRLCGLLWVSQRLAELGKGDEHPVY